MSDTTESGVPEFVDDTASESGSVVLSPDQVCNNIANAAEDAVDTGDWLSYATLIDVYFGEVSESFEPSDKVRLLNVLNEVMEKHPQVAYEIGWDLPPIAFKYLDAPWIAISGGLRESEGIIAVVKTFEILSREGNGKELLLRSCELLSTLYRLPPYTEEELALYPDVAAGLQMQPVASYKMKYHLLCELVSSSLKKIETNYPSRFLGMAVTSLINFFDTAKSYAAQAFFARRAYTFMRDYTPPPTPVPPKDDEEELAALAKVHETEKYLQRKLLCFFLSVVVEQTVSRYPTDMTLSYFRKLRGTRPSIVKETLRENSEDASITEDSREVVDRFVTLAQSFDLDLQKEFEDELVRTQEMFESLDYTEPLEVQNDALFQLVIDKYNNTGLRNKPDIGMPPFGLFLLFSHTMAFTYTERKFSISPQDAIKFYIRFAIPAVIKSEERDGSQDALLHLCWRSIYEYDGDCEQELGAMEPIFLNTFLQVLTTESTRAQGHSRAKMLQTLIAKVLTLIPEQVAYDYLLNSLQTCPYEQVKPTFISILKDLVLRFRPVSVKNVTEDLDKASLSGPKLPPRASAAYISLTAERQKDIEELIRSSIDDIPTSDNMDASHAGLSVQTLLSYLNLLYFLGSRFPQDISKELIDLVSAKVKKFDANVSEESKKSAREAGFNIDLLGLAVDSLAKKAKAT